MADSLYKSMQPPTSNLGNNPLMQLIPQIKQFGQALRGNPQQMVEQLLQSGQMSQTEFNNYAQMAKQLEQMVKF